MNHVQMLATHNSYHIRLEPAPISEWDYFFDPIETQLEEQGVRALELDLNYDVETLEYQVFHIPFVDFGTTCLRFDDCLAYFECTTHAWHTEGDHVIVIARVHGLDHRARDPLLFCGGKFAVLDSSASNAG